MTVKTRDDSHPPPPIAKCPAKPECAKQSENQGGPRNDDKRDDEDQVCLTLAFSGPAAARYGEPEGCKLNTLRENQVAAGSAATPC